MSPIAVIPWAAAFPGLFLFVLGLMLSLHGHGQRNYGVPFIRDTVVAYTEAVAAVRPERDDRPYR